MTTNMKLAAAILALAVTQIGTTTQAATNSRRLTQISRPTRRACYPDWADGRDAYGLSGYGGPDDLPPVYGAPGYDGSDFAGSGYGVPEFGWPNDRWAAPVPRWPQSSGYPGMNGLRYSPPAYPSYGVPHGSWYGLSPEDREWMEPADPDWDNRYPESGWSGSGRGGSRYLPRTYGDDFGRSRFDSDYGFNTFRPRHSGYGQPSAPLFDDDAYLP